MGQAGLHKDRDWLHQKYVVEELSAAEIAKLADCHPTTVWYQIYKYNIPIRSPGRCTRRQIVTRCFWKHVSKKDPDECWEWVGSRGPGGYGRLQVNGKLVGAHRVSWMLHNGPIPKGMYICHHCDNPPCVNPKHLFLGTPVDNAHDRDRKALLNFAKEWAASAALFE